MRALLIPVIALALAACGKKDQSTDNQIAGDSLTADAIVSNDVTAIDAVTADAANMAADVDMNFGNLEPSGEATSNEGAGKSERPASRRPSASAPQSNSVGNSTSNAATNEQ